MLFLELVLDDRPVQDPFEAVQKLEFSHYCIVIIKSLSHN